VCRWSLEIMDERCGVAQQRTRVLCESKSQGSKCVSCFETARSVCFSASAPKTRRWTISNKLSAAQLFRLRGTEMSLSLTGPGALLGSAMTWICLSQRSKGSGFIRKQGVKKESRAPSKNSAFTDANTHHAA